MWSGRAVCAGLLLAGAVCRLGMAQVEHGGDGQVSYRNPLAASPAEASGAGREDGAGSGSGNATETTAGVASSAIAAGGIAAAMASRTSEIRPFSTVAVGFQITSLGAGFQVATPLSRNFNLRGGANFFSFTYDFGTDGADYNFDLQLRSGQASLDWFPFRGSFHVSPGLIVYKSQLSGTATMPAGKSFLLGSESFTSSPTDPVHGDASLTFSRSLMPLLTFGLGNIIPRSGRHWSAPVEVGVAYTGHTSVALNLQGTACTQYGCLSTSDPRIQQNIVNEQNNLNESIKRLQAYPILSTGVAYRF
jgi:hypothetical protein